MKHFQEYQEPDESNTTTGSARKPVTSPDGEGVLLPLGETTLTQNMGVPIVVVITKVGNMFFSFLSMNDLKLKFKFF